jgi:co-chaperonin GroES (HSP10)
MSETIVKPKGDYVYLAKNKKDVVSKGGIHLDIGGINGVVASDTWQCTVLAIGPDVKDVKIGDICVLNWHKAHEIVIDDKRRVMISEKEIYFVVEQE